MIDIPLNKALVPVESHVPNVENGEPNKEKCAKCFFYRLDKKINKREICYSMLFNCEPRNRKDGKNVIFKLVYYPPKSELKAESEIVPLLDIETKAALRSPK